MCPQPLRYQGQQDSEPMPGSDRPRYLPTSCSLCPLVRRATPLQIYAGQPRDLRGLCHFKSRGPAPFSFRWLYRNHRRSCVFY